MNVHEYQAKALFREFVGAALERARSRTGLAQSAGQHVPM